MTWGHGQCTNLQPDFKGTLLLVTPNHRQAKDTKHRECKSDTPFTHTMTKTGKRQLNTRGGNLSSVTIWQLASCWLRTTGNLTTREHNLAGGVTVNLLDRHSDTDLDGLGLKWQRQKDAGQWQLAHRDREKAIGNKRTWLTWQFCSWHPFGGELLGLWCSEDPPCWRNDRQPFWQTQWHRHRQTRTEVTKTEGRRTVTAGSQGNGMSGQDPQLALTPSLGSACLC